MTDGFFAPDLSLLEKLKGLREAGRSFRVWWSAPVDHFAQVEYFAARGLLGPVQLLIGVCCLLLGSVPAVLLGSPTGPQHPAENLVYVGFIVSAVAWALVWWIGRWPSRRWSIAFIVYADIGITTISLLDSNRLAGLFGLTTFVLVSLYIQFFEGPKVLACHTAWICLVIATMTIQIGTGAGGDPSLAIAKTIAAVPGLALTPVVIQFGIWLLCHDAVESTRDQLTHVLNRRGLQLQLQQRLQDPADDCGDVLMAMVIDLDQFKKINDTHGHAIGDEVLVRTARRIEHAVRSSAVVARVGGEEFVVVDIADSASIATIAERVRTGIAAPAEVADVTASIGVATITCDLPVRPLADNSGKIRDLVADADHAMFDAKRHGGNAIRYTQCTQDAHRTG